MEGFRWVGGVVGRYVEVYGGISGGVSRCIDVVEL